MNEFHKAVVDVPDERLSKLADFFKTPPVHAKIEYLDTGAVSFGDTKNTTFIDLIRRADGLVHMVRDFKDEEILHPKGEIDPVRDIRSMEEELITTDFLTVEKRIERIESDLKKIKQKELVEELELLKKIASFLPQAPPCFYKTDVLKHIFFSKIGNSRVAFEIALFDKHPEFSGSSDIFCAIGIIKRKLRVQFKIPGPVRHEKVLYFLFPV